MEDRAYRFNEASRFDKSYREIADLVRPEFKDIIENYIHNMDSVESMGMTPLLFGRLGKYFSDIHNEGIRTVRKTMSGPPTVLIGGPDSMEQVEKYLEYEKQLIILESIEKSLELENEDKSELLGLNVPDVLVARMLEVIGAVGKDEFRRGMDAILAGMVTGTWTAFEAMAGDLWVSALNVCPGKLAALLGQSKRIGKLAGTKAEKLEQTENLVPVQGHAIDQTKYISLNEAKRITGGNFDLSAHMGTIHKTNRKFTSLAGIREAYSLAFSDHADFIDSALSDHSLDALSLVRNLIVHRAGIADEVYSSSATSVPLAPQINEGERLELNGEITIKLIRPVILNCVKLIKSVESYISRK